MLLAVVLALALVIPPAPSARVNDYAGVLKPDEVRRLETRLAEREQATGAQMVVAIFPSLDGESVEDVGIRLAERWRIGQKSLDNGVILLVFLRERRVRMEIGYGLEPVLPDAVAGQIIRDHITPRFREGKYAAGIEAAVGAVFERIGPPDASGKPTARPTQRGGPDMPAWIFLPLVIVASLLYGMFARKNRRRNGYTADRGGWSAPVFFPGSGGGWSGGGGGGGGGFSGGGGGFGGGGASGDW
ncbi:MAG TPA: TPM domain-containing protein [Methylomirabilota bacterium]|nr:TPM domain-containing protein [Methylomirabilota bacterium]